jgi:hypothetical protein
LTSFGLQTTHLDALVKEGHIDAFCAQMLDKEVMFSVEGLPEYRPPEIEKGDEISDQIAEHFDTFREHTE